MLSPDKFLFVAVMMFAIGLIGLMLRRNLFVVYLSIELMLSSVNLILATFSRMHGEMDGGVVSLLMIAVIAAEAAIFLALIIYIYRITKSVDSQSITQLTHKRDEA